MRRDPDGWRVLVLRCYGNWDFPKGKLEQGEGARAAATREAKEEADLDDLVWSWGEQSCDTPRYGKGKVATYFLAETQRTDVVLPVNPALGHPEHHEGRWVDLDTATTLMPTRLAGVWAWARGVLEGGS